MLRERKTRESHTDLMALALLRLLLSPKYTSDYQVRETAKEYRSFLSVPLPPGLSGVDMYSNSLPTL